MKVSFTEKKVLYFKESISFQCKYYIKESIILNKKFTYLKESILYYG